MRTCEFYVLCPNIDNSYRGGVVSATYFQEQFGIIVNGKTDTKKSNDISSNVVSVLQAGAFFGALGSAPISCTFVHSHWSRIQHLCPYGAVIIPAFFRPSLSPCLSQLILIHPAAKIGRRKTLLGFIIIFVVGAVRNALRHHVKFTNDSSRFSQL